MNGYENNSDVNLHFYFKRALAAHSILSMDTSMLYPPPPPLKHRRALYFIAST